MTADEAQKYRAAAVAAAQAKDKAALALGDDAAQALSWAGLWTPAHLVQYTALSNIDRLSFWTSGGALESLAGAAGKGLSPVSQDSSASAWVLVGLGFLAAYLVLKARSRRSEYSYEEGLANIDAIPAEFLDEWENAPPSMRNADHMGGFYGVSTEQASTWMRQAGLKTGALEGLEAGE
jgi:hypothetical protein